VIPILHRDAELLVVDKPAGLLTHRTELAPDRDVAMMRARDTLQALLDAERAASEAPELPEESSDAKTASMPEAAYVYPVHRLDRGTSGALAFALTEDAARSYRTAFDEGRVEKVYYALARGTMPAEAHVEYAIPKAEGKERVMAVTDFRLLHAGEWFCLVEARPRTGKFHQIRRHLAHLRHPIAGDTNYGTGWFTRKVREEGGLLRLGLHAASITLPGPAHAPSPITVRAPLASDFREALLRFGVPEALVATL
jgi:tRNA pseudouridine65 synthase